MNSSRRILITGAAGFIGGAIFSHLKNMNYDVVGVDNMSNYYDPSMKLAHLTSVDLLDELKLLDIQDSNALQELFKKFRPQIVIHLAAQGGVRAARRNPEPYILTNQLGFMNMIKASEIHGVEHFMYASSSSVYGDRENGPFKEDSKLSEPKSLYALSKLANEIIARDYPSKGMKRTGLRFFTVYGPWGRPDMAIFRVLTAAHLGKTFNLTADLSVLRDFTYINDLCNSVHSLMQTNDLEANSIFNIAGGKPRPLADIFGFLKSIGAVVDLANVGSDPSDVKMTYGSVEKLADTGVYVPGTCLEDGLLATWNWLQSVDPVELAQWYDFSSN